MKIIFSNKKQILFFVLLLLLLLYIIYAVFILKSTYLDDFNFNQTENKIAFFKILTVLGNWYTLVFLTVISLSIKKRNLFKYITINLSLVFLLSQLLKILFKRIRPELNILNVKGYSFPSGHAMVGTAFYGFLIYLIFLSKIKKIYKLILILIMSFIIIGICCSRVYLGAHYITDVVAGICFSIMYLIIFTGCIKIKEKII